jgi:FkbM family methyltransferase
VTAVTIHLPFVLRLLQKMEFPRKLGVCARVFGRSLGKHGVCWVDTGAGIPWKLDLGNTTHRWIVYGKYEGAEFLDWAKDYLPSDGVVVDSGANIGQMLLYLAQWIPRGRLLAFEPGAHSADWLQECLAANPGLPVELLRLGLGEQPEQAYLEEMGPADRHGSWNQISDAGGEPIELVRLCDVLSERGIDHVDLWKLDVEGFEVHALRGAADLLAEKRVGALCVELHGENGCAVRNLMEGFGYDCWLFRRNGKLAKPAALPEQANGLFLPSS